MDAITQMIIISFLSIIMVELVVLNKMMKNALMSVIKVKMSGGKKYLVKVYNNLEAYYMTCTYIEGKVYIISRVKDPYLKKKVKYVLNVPEEYLPKLITTVFNTKCFEVSEEKNAFKFIGRSNLNATTETVYQTDKEDKVVLDKNGNPVIKMAGIEIYGFDAVTGYDPHKYDSVTERALMEPPDKEELKKLLIYCLIANGIIILAIVYNVYMTNQLKQSIALIPKQVVYMMNQTIGTNVIVT